MVAPAQIQMLKFKNSLLQAMQTPNQIKITKINTFKVKISKAYLRIWKKKKMLLSKRYKNKTMFTLRIKRRWRNSSRTVNLFI